MDDYLNSISVSCIQYTSKIDELITLETIKSLIRKAIDLGSDFITLPECATSLHENPEITKKLSTSEEDNHSLYTFKKIAETNSVYILIGSLHMKINNGITNRSYLIGSNGKILYRYDKIHMFDVNIPNNESYKESNTYLPSSKAVIAKIQLKSIIK